MDCNLTNLCFSHCCNFTMKDDKDPWFCDDWDFLGMFIKTSAESFTSNLRNLFGFDGNIQTCRYLFLSHLMLHEKITLFFFMERFLRILDRSRTFKRLSYVSSSM